MVAEAEVICKQSLVVNYLCVPSPAPKLETDFVDVSRTATVSTVSINSPTLRSPESLESIDFSRPESVRIEPSNTSEHLETLTCLVLAMQDDSSEVRKKGLKYCEDSLQSTHIARA